MRFIVKVQAQSRGVIQRRRYAKLKAALAKGRISIQKLQAVARAKLAKKTHQQIQKKLGQTHTNKGIIAMQATARKVLAGEVAWTSRMRPPREDTEPVQSKYGYKFSMWERQCLPVKVPR